MGHIVFFSSRSENTKRFVEKLDMPATRLPLESDTPTPMVTEPFVLILPSYGSGGVKGAVPKPVVQFLNDVANRSFIRGVIAAGNINFGAAFGLAGDIVSAKCAVPLLYRFELLGTEEDVMNVKRGLGRFWTRSF